MSRLTQARPAVRPALKARLMVSGPTGAGKTWTSLRIAEVLDEGRGVLLIDTEKESALTYADNFTFTHLPWLPPYDPRDLGRTIAEAGRTYDVIIVDSTSHFWRKQGGTLDIAGGKFTGWKDARPAQEDLVDAILGCAAHVILCTRSKMEHVQEERNGKHVVVKLGMAPQQDDDLEYELNIAIELDMDHRATVSKSRCEKVDVGRMFTAGHEVELAGLYAEWLRGGEPPASQAVVDELVARINLLPPDLRVACKTRFMETCGRPEHLRSSREGEAEALVAEFEAQASQTSGPDGPGVAPSDGGEPHEAGEGGARNAAGPSPDAATPEHAGTAEVVPQQIELGGEEAAEGTGGSLPPLAAGPTSGLVTLDDLLNRMEGKAAATRKGRLLKVAAEVAKEHSWPAPETVDKIDQRLLEAIAAGLPAETVELTAKQNAWLHAIWGDHDAVGDAVSRATSGRVDSTSELTAQEWAVLSKMTEEAAA